MVGKRRILAIDNDSSTLATIRDMISVTEDYEIKIVQESQDAIDIINEEQFDIILLDLSMPYIPGYDIAKIIRNRWVDKVKILYVSSFSPSEVDVRYADDFLQKPFTRERLLSKIRELLN